MNKKILLLLLSLLLLSAVSCSLFIPDEIDGNLVGKWAGMGLILEFNEDGTGLYQNITYGTWGVRNSDLYFCESLPGPDGEMPEYLTGNQFWGIKYIISGDDVTFGDNNIFSMGFYLKRLTLTGSEIGGSASIYSSTDHTTGFIKDGTVQIVWDDLSTEEGDTQFVVTEMDIENYYSYEVIGDYSYASNILSLTADFDNNTGTAAETKIFQLN